MDRSLLNALSPQLQQLVSASLGEELPVHSAAPVPPPAASVVKPVKCEKPTQREPKDSAQAAKCSTSASSTRLNPSEVFGAYVHLLYFLQLRSDRLSDAYHAVLQHPESPGFIVREGFLGADDAVRLRDALQEVAAKETFQDARVGSAGNVRKEQTLRGDRIHWIKRPKDLKNSNALHPAILLLMRRIEGLVYGLKQVSPLLDLRNVTSTQFAIFVRSTSLFGVRLIRTDIFVWFVAGKRKSLRKARGYVLARAL